MGTQLPQKGHSPHFSAHVHCGKTAGWIKMPLGMEVGLSPGHFVLDGNWAPPPPKKGTQAPNFRPMSILANGWMDQDATWYRGRPRQRQLCVSWRLGSPKTGHSPPPFSVHVYCGQMARWIKMPLGMEVYLGPGDIVLDGDPVPPKRGMPPIFVPCLLWPNGSPSQLLQSSCTLAWWPWFYTSA